MQIIKITAINSAARGKCLPQYSLKIIITFDD